MSLKRFIAMAQEVGLVGSSLSFLQLKEAFVSSLPHGASEALLLSGPRFHEAILRLARAYEPITGALRPLGGRSLLASVRPVGRDGLAELRTELQNLGWDLWDFEKLLLERLPIVCAKLVASLPITASELDQGSPPSASKADAYLVYEA